MARSGTHVRAARRGRILVVDDEPFVARALEIFLGDEHDVHVATTPHDALEILRRGDSFDAVLCDIMMPRMKGTELHAAVAGFDPRTASRFVFITGGIFDEDVRGYVADTHLPCIDKPPDPFALRAMMRRSVATAIDEEAGARVAGKA
jgi:CheY-like chemotaxis protein